MAELLFVYGTLRRGFSRHVFLERLGAQFVGRASTQAELHDLGKFPGAKKSKRREARVTGEIYRLANPERALKVLDAVEGLRGGAPTGGMFRRERAQVSFPNGKHTLAWVYWLNNWKGPRRRVRSGDYAENSEQ